MKTREIPFVFDCQGEDLIGIVHQPEQSAERGLLVLVAGGPQYRIGCCRQQVETARALAAEGIPVMRYDYRSMGDASGDDPGFERNHDINAAVEAFLAQVPGLKEVVIYGGCDGASAIAIAAWEHPAICGWVLNNPYTEMESSQAKVMVKHYYRERLMSRDLWMKILRLDFDWRGSFRSLFETLGKLKSDSSSQSDSTQDPFDPAIPFTERMLEGWKRFEGDILLLMSGRSLVAKEFDECVESSSDWQAVVGRDNVHRCVLKNADHTFSEEQSRRSLIKALTAWFKDYPNTPGCQ